MEDKMPERSEGSPEASQRAPDDDLLDGDRQWIETILADHAQRSPVAQQALTQALIDGQSANSPAPREERTTSPRSSPVSGTTLFSVSAEPSRSAWCVFL